MKRLLPLSDEKLEKSGWRTQSKSRKNKSCCTRTDLTRCLRFVCVCPSSLLWLVLIVLRKNDAWMRVDFSVETEVVAYV